MPAPRHSLATGRPDGGLDAGDRRDADGDHHHRCQVEHEGDPGEHDPPAISAGAVATATDVGRGSAPACRAARRPEGAASAPSAPDAEGCARARRRTARRAARRRGSPPAAARSSMRALMSVEVGQWRRGVRRELGVDVRDAVDDTRRRRRRRRSRSCLRTKRSQSVPPPGCTSVTQTTDQVSATFSGRRGRCAAPGRGSARRRWTWSVVRSTRVTPRGVPALTEQGTRAQQHSLIAGLEEAGHQAHPLATGPSRQDGPSSPTNASGRAQSLSSLPATVGPCAPAAGAAADRPMRSSRATSPSRPAGRRRAARSGERGRRAFVVAQDEHPEAFTEVAVLGARRSRRAPGSSPRCAPARGRPSASLPDAAPVVSW